MTEEELWCQVALALVNKLPNVDYPTSKASDVLKLTNCIVGGYKERFPEVDHSEGTTEEP